MKEEKLDDVQERVIKRKLATPEEIEKVLGRISKIRMSNLDKQSETAWDEPETEPEKEMPPMNDAQWKSYRAAVEANQEKIKKLMASVDPSKLDDVSKSSVTPLKDTTCPHCGGTGHIR